MPNTGLELVTLTEIKSHTLHRQSQTGAPILSNFIMRVSEPKISEAATGDVRIGQCETRNPKAM